MKFYELEISETETGNIELRQYGGCIEDDTIIISKEQAKIVAAELIRIADSALKTEG